MEYSLLYYIVVYTGAVTLAVNFVKLVLWVDTPHKKRRHTAR